MTGCKSCVYCMCIQEADVRVLAVEMKRAWLIQINILLTAPAVSFNSSIFIDQLIFLRALILVLVLLENLLLASYTICYCCYVAKITVLTYRVENS